MGSLIYEVKGRFECELSSRNIQCSAAKLLVLCSHLVNANEDLGGLATTVKTAFFCQVLLVLVVLG